VKVRHLLASPFFSGPASLVLELALAQRALGHEVTVSIDALRTTLTSEELAAPHFLSSQLLTSGALELSVKSSPLGLLRDITALRSLTADVVHCHFTHDHVLARLALHKKVKLIRSIHAPRSIRWSLPKAHGFTVPFASLEPRIPNASVMTLAPIISSAFSAPANRSELRKTLGLGDERKIIGMVSTFQKSRNHEIALAALAHLPNALLVLVGDGEEGPKLKQRVAALHLEDRVKFVGYQSGASFVEYVQCLDEVWILGLGNDFSARAAAQARGCGVRVVAVAEGNLPAFADVLVPLSAEALAKASQSNERLARCVLLAPEIAQQTLKFYESVRL
jgi:L-malate glycosyltransferase